MCELGRASDSNPVAVLTSKECTVVSEHLILRAELNRLLSENHLSLVRLKLTNFWGVPFGHQPDLYDNNSATTY